MKLFYYETEGRLHSALQDYFKEKLLNKNKDVID